MPTETAKNPIDDLENLEMMTLGSNPSSRPAVLANGSIVLTSFYTQSRYDLHFPKATALSDSDVNLGANLEDIRKSVGSSWRNSHLVLTLKVKPRAAASSCSFIISEFGSHLESETACAQSG